MNIKIIVNPKAGSGKAREIGFRTEKHLCDLGIEYSLDSTFRPKGAVSLAKKATRDGFDLIIVVGGDGTVNEVANGMIGSLSTLAVIPAGHHNNFAKMLGLDTKDIKSAIDTALGSGTRLIDVGKINGVFFVNGIGIGLNAKAANRIEEKYQKSNRKDNYLMKILSELRGFEPPYLSIKMDDMVLYSKTALAKIANGPFHGKGYRTVPQALADDGYLDVCVLNHTNKLRLLSHLPRFFGGRLKKPYPLTTFKAARITIDSKDPISAVYDGELIETSSPFDIEVAAEKIAVKSK